MSRWAIGVDLGGTGIKAAIVGEESGILTKQRALTDTASGPTGIVGQLAAIITDLYHVASETLDVADFAGYF